MKSRFTILMMVVLPGIMVSLPNCARADGPDETPMVRAPGTDDVTWKFQVQMRKALLEKNQPIVFHARALDQNNEPVPGARLELQLHRVDEQRVRAEFPHMKMGSELTKEPIVLQSNNAGWFHLTNHTGNYLAVMNLSRDGYFWKTSGYLSFDYDKENQPADYESPQKGFTFHLWKKGPVEKLIPIAFATHLANDRPRAWFGLFPGKGVSVTEATADFAIVRTMLHKDDPSRQYDRRISIVGLHGLEIVETADPYPYAAPKTGYAPAIYYDILPSEGGYGPGGTWSWKKNFYFKARHGKTFGAITIDFDSGNMNFRITGYVNPSGSRNLEPDPAQFIKDPTEIRKIDNLLPKE